MARPDKRLRCLLAALPFALAPGIMTMVVGCAASEPVAQSPENTVRLLFDAARRGDVEDMATCYSPDASTVVSPYLAVLQDPDARERFLSRMKEAPQVNIQQTSVSGNTATVLAIISIDGQASKEVYHLRLIGGEWKIE